MNNKMYYLVHPHFFGYRQQNLLIKHYQHRNMRHKNTDNSSYQTDEDHLYIYSLNNDIMPIFMK